MPVGTIIQNHKGEYAVVGPIGCIRVTKEQAEEIVRKADAKTTIEN